MAERRGLTRLTNFPRVTGSFSEILVALAAGDEFFGNVVLLLDFAGADAATNISDLSRSEHNDETFVADAQVDTAIQALGTNTLLLDGTLDYIHFPDSADWDFGTGDFTIEFSFRTSIDARTAGILSNRFDTTTGWSIQQISGGNLRLLNGDTEIKAETFDPVEGTMYHVAISRSGTSLRMFIDGVELGTATTDSTSLTGSTSPLAIGALPLPAQYVGGSVGAVRITKGVGRYTENFTAPSEFYDITGPAAVDSDFSSVVLLLPLDDDMTGNVEDFSGSAHTVTRESGVASQATARFGAAGDFGSDGTEGKYLTVPDSADFDFGTDDFTIELWVWHDILPSGAPAGNRMMIDKASSDPSSRSWEFGWVTDNSFQFNYSTNGTSVVSVDSPVQSISTGQWYHVAVTRESNIVRLYLDGVKVKESDEGSKDYATTADPVTIGEFNFTGFRYDFIGNFDDIRITKGVARYGTADFDPPNQAHPTQ